MSTAPTPGPPPPPPPSGPPVDTGQSSRGTKLALTMVVAAVGAVVLLLGLLVVGVLLFGLVGFQSSAIEEADVVDAVEFEPAPPADDTEEPLPDSAAAADELVPQPDPADLEGDAARQCQDDGGQVAADRDLLYCLDPDWQLWLGEALQEVGPATTSGLAGAVELTFREGPDGIDRFNELAAFCFDLAPQCPTGQLAVVSGDTVISAPAVTARSFGRDQVVISSGDDDWIQQGDLARAVADADIQPVRWMVPLADS